MSRILANTLAPPSMRALADTPLRGRHLEPNQKVQSSLYLTHATPPPPQISPPNPTSPPPLPTPYPVAIAVTWLTAVLFIPSQFYPVTVCKANTVRKPYSPTLFRCCVWNWTHPCPCRGESPPKLTTPPNSSEGRLIEPCLGH